MSRSVEGTDQTVTDYNVKIILSVDAIENVMWNIDPLPDKLTSSCLFIARQNLIHQHLVWALRLCQKQMN